MLSGFRILFFISAGFLLLHIALPQDFNIAFTLLTIILLIRSSVRCEFEWNPLTLKTNPVSSNAMQKVGTIEQSI